MTDKVVASHPFNRVCVQQALTGSADALMCSFLFKSSPQGVDFWGDQVAALWSGERLSEQARNYLQLLLEAEAYIPTKPFFVRKYVEEALKGNATALAHCMSFDQTPQGRTYWLGELKGVEEGGWLSEESVAYLESLLAEDQLKPFDLKCTEALSVEQTWLEKIKNWFKKFTN
jgi:hypothetical protein